MIDKNNTARITGGIVLLLLGIVWGIPAISAILLPADFMPVANALNESFWQLGLQHAGTGLLVLGAGLLLSGSSLGFKNAGVLFIAIVAIKYFIQLFIYTINVPINDDFAVILRFSNNYFSEESLFKKVELLTAFHAECRLIVTRLWIIVIHFFTGVVNIKTLIIIGNLCLPVIVFLFYKNMSGVKSRIAIVSCIALLFFQFGYYDATTWATDALHYQYTILFVMLSLYLLSKQSITAQVAAMVTGLLAALTFGNGLLIFPLAILHTIVNRNYKLGVVWLMLATGFACTYFVGFSSGKAFTLHALHHYFIYSCCFVGGAFQFMYRLELPFMAGLVVWALFAWLTWKQYYRKNYVVYGLLLFVILSSLVAAQFRLHMGMAEAISNRYGIFSILAICASLVALTEVIVEGRQVWFTRTALVFCATYYLLSAIFFFPEVPIRKQKLEKYMADIKNNRPVIAVEPIVPEGADKTVREAIVKKLYRP